MPVKNVYKAILSWKRLTFIFYQTQHYTFGTYLSRKFWPLTQYGVIAASTTILNHRWGGVPPISAEEKIRKKQVILVQKMMILALLGPFYYKISIVPGGRGEEAM